MIRKLFTRRMAGLLAVLAGLFLVASPSLALLVRPIILDLNSLGSGSNGQIEVVNDRNRPSTVELKVNNFSLPESGELKMGEDASADFVIFPTIAQLQPGARQVFRIRYVGEPKPAQSRLYMFTSSELPVSEQESGETVAKIDVLYAISSMVGVRAPGTKAAINVANVERASGGKDGKEPGLRILFDNRGPAHGYVGGTQLDLVAGSWRKSIPADITGKAFGLGLVPANGRRSLFVPLADAPASGPITVEIKPGPVS